jgi:hypothetical protein
MCTNTLCHQFWSRRKSATKRESCLRLRCGFQCVKSRVDLVPPCQTTPQPTQLTMYPLEDTSSLTLLTLAAAIVTEQDQKDSRLSWKQCNLTIEGRRRRDRCYPRSAIKPYSKSPFVYLLNSRNDQALLNATGVDFDEFNQLLIQFQPVFDSFTVDESTGKIVAKTRHNKGRKRSIDAKGALGLVLMWYRTKGPCNRMLPLVFGLTFTSMMKWLLFAKKCLFVALRDYTPSTMQISTTK